MDEGNQGREIMVEGNTARLEAKLQKFWAGCGARVADADGQGAVAF